MPDDSVYRKVLRLMGRGRDEYGSVPEDLRGELLEKKEEYLIRNGAWYFKSLVKSTRGKNNSFRIFSLKELQKATNNFSADKILSDSDPNAYTYRGIIEDRHVLVKYSYHFVIYGAVSLSLIKHRNVVKLLGCCLETCFPIVVHELPPNGTLEENISKLSWTDRLRIATEIADALTYLHSELHMTHGSLYSTEAILLDEFHSAKLSALDFSEILNQAESSDVETDIRNKRRKRDDVHNFGEILVNLLGIQTDDRFKCLDRFKFIQCFVKVEVLKYVKMNVSEKEMPQIEAYIHLLLRCQSSHKQGWNFLPDDELSIEDDELFSSYSKRKKEFVGDKLFSVDQYYKLRNEFVGDDELSIEEVARELGRIRSMINHHQPTTDANE